MRTNASTCLPPQNLTAASAPSLETAYAVALAAEHARQATTEGYRLYWMTEGWLGSCDVPLHPESFVVVGRHAMCDAVLDADPTIALRHLLVRATRLDDGCPRLSVLDLHTNIGFDLPGARQERSLAASGPIAFHVGAYALVALPTSEPLPEALPEPACSRALVPHPYRDVPSSITLLPRALSLGESHAAPAVQVLTMRSARGWATLQLSALDLEVGILVGRAPKCADILRNLLHEGISRVHLLLRKNRIYDLASTQGTWVSNGAQGWNRTRSTSLEGARLCIGSTSAVSLSFDYCSVLPPGGSGFCSRSR